MDIFGSENFKSYYHVIIIGSSPFWNLLIFSPSLVCLMPKRPLFNRSVLRLNWRGKETAIFLLRHAIEKGVKLHPDGGYQRSLNVVNVTHYVSTVLMSLLYKYHLGTHSMVQTKKISRFNHSKLKKLGSALELLSTLDYQSFKS